MIDKENLGKNLLIVWGTVAAIYIGYITWTDYKIKGVSEAYQAGKADTISGVIKQAQDANCQSFTVFNGDQKVELVATSCLQKAQQAQGAPQTPPAQGAVKTK